MNKNWFVYIVQCADTSLYTGITTQLERRLAEHNDPQHQKSAKYTRMRQPVRLVYSYAHSDRSSASRDEWRIKHLSRAEKLALCDL